MFPLLAAALASTAGPATVGPGSWTPLYKPPGEEPTVAVGPFLLDRQQVTNADFLAFVAARPAWRRDRVARILAEPSYLRAWTDPTTLSPQTPPEAPVVQVSWFAARAYCASVGKRLPTEAEWELAAMAGDRGPDGSKEPGWTERILSWYARPAALPLPPASQGAVNAWGVRGLHGVVWEWVDDFNSMLVSVDNREQTGADDTVFCGAGALGASSRDDYASFMRIALRSSLRGDMTTSSLGFRCASDL